MSKDIVKVDNKSQSMMAGNMAGEQVDLIKKTVAIGATDDELKMFLYTSNRTGLDPLARQIYFMKRRVWNKSKNTYDEKVSIQSSIDGFRVVAERSGSYAGQDEPDFQEDTNGKPVVCKVRVFKFSPAGERYQASVGVAYWSEYCPATGSDFMWQKMPHTMIAKVAEALALRKAFPQDLSGLYTGEEMQQADLPANAKTPDVEKTVTTDEILEAGRELPVINRDEEAGQAEEDRFAGLMLCSFEGCGSEITEKVKSYSEKMFGRALCFNHQKEVKAKKK